MHGAAPYFIQGRKTESVGGITYVTFGNRHLLVKILGGKSPCIILNMMLEVVPELAKRVEVVGNKWTGIIPSDVQVDGYMSPKTTVYQKL